MPEATGWIRIPLLDGIQVTPEVRAELRYEAHDLAARSGMRVVREVGEQAEKVGNGPWLRFYIFRTKDAR